MCDKRGWWGEWTVERRNTNEKVWGKRREKGVGETTSQRKTRKCGETRGLAHEAQRECEQESQARRIAIADRSSKISRVDLGRR